MSHLDRIKGMGIKTGIFDRSLPGDGSDGKWTYSGETVTQTDTDLDRWYTGGAVNNDLDRVIVEVSREVDAMRWSGKLMPFRKGQHAGMLPQRVRVKKLTPAQLTKMHNERMERQREDMLQLRARNDATIDKLTTRRF